MLDSEQANTATAVDVRIDIWTALGTDAKAGVRGGTGGRFQSAVSRTLRWAEVRGALHGPRAQPLLATDAWLLDAIVAHDGVRVSGLTLWQGVDKSTVTPQVQVHRLENRGLVTRRSPPADRRVVLLTATEQGRALHTALAAAGARYMDDVLAHWTEPDRQSLAVLLSRFADELGPRTTPPARPALSWPDRPDDTYA